MSAPSVNVQTSIANSLPIIEATCVGLVGLTTPPTLATQEEVGYRTHVMKVLATCSKTGYPSALAAAIVPATVNPLIEAVAAAQIVYNAAKSNDDVTAAKAALVAAQEAVMTYYTVVFSALP
jgi:hypothetical protein